MLFVGFLHIFFFFLCICSIVFVHVPTGLLCFHLTLKILLLICWCCVRLAGCYIPCLFRSTHRKLDLKGGWEREKHGTKLCDNSCHLSSVGKNKHTHTHTNTHTLASHPSASSCILWILVCQFCSVTRTCWWKWCVWLWLYRDWKAILAAPCIRWLPVALNWTTCLCIRS